jgi:catechol 2,3-dioxygenase-like lactoylglutathione lyase family enzyme
MKKQIKIICLLVKNYDETIQFYTEKLGFELKQDENYGENMRWVTLRASSQSDLQIGLSLAETETDLNLVGRQSGSFPFFSLEVEDCFVEYENLQAKGVHFVQQATQTPYGISAMYEDLYGNLIFMRQV